jgi:DNA-binding response OmpR family regulator
MITQPEIPGAELGQGSVSDAADDTRQLRVLLVEDDRSLRRYLEVVLEREGYEVIAAVDGLEAMRATLTSRVDLVVTDAIMPNLNGYELVRFLRSTPELCRLPVVLLSAMEIKDNGGEYKADVYLSKPVSPDALINCLGELLRKE